MERWRHVQAASLGNSILITTAGIVHMNLRPQAATKRLGR